MIDNHTNTRDPRVFLHNVQKIPKGHVKILREYFTGKLLVNYSLPLGRL